MTFFNVTIIQDATISTETNTISTETDYVNTVYITTGTDTLTAESTTHTIDTITPTTDTQSLTETIPNHNLTGIPSLTIRSTSTATIKRTDYPLRSFTTPLPKATSPPAPSPPASSSTSDPSLPPLERRIFSGSNPSTNANTNSQNPGNDNTKLSYTSSLRRDAGPALNPFHSSQGPFQSGTQAQWD